MRLKEETGECEWDDNKRRVWKSERRDEENERNWAREGVRKGER